MYVLSVNWFFSWLVRIPVALLFIAMVTGIHLIFHLLVEGIIWFWKNVLVPLITYPLYKFPIINNPTIEDYCNKLHVPPIWVDYFCNNFQIPLLWLFMTCLFFYFQKRITGWRGARAVIGSIIEKNWHLINRFFELLLHFWSRLVEWAAVVIVTGVRSSGSAFRRVWHKE